MKVGEVVLLHPGATINFPSGLVSSTGYLAAVKVLGVDPENGTFTWRDGVMGPDRVTPISFTRTLPCVWILGVDTTCHQRDHDALERPLADLGVQVALIQMSRVFGLHNIPDTENPVEFTSKVTSLVAKILGKE